MKERERSKKEFIKVLSAVLAGVLLLTVLLLTVGFVYRDAEDKALHELHVDTKEIKDDINIQMASDRENLVTMASLAATYYERYGKFDILFESFEPIGLIEYIGILTPNNEYMTKDGVADASGKLSFGEDIEKGEYVSGVVKSVTLPERNVVRSGVPIKVDGETVAMLYGVSELSTFNEKYGALISESYLCVIDENGNFVANTLAPGEENASIFSEAKFINGCSYETFLEDMSGNNDGYAAFKSKKTGDEFYIHYAGLDLGGWQIMLIENYNKIFSEARRMGSILLFLFAVCMTITVLYIVITMKIERKDSKIARTASKMRKLLLELNQQSGSMGTALYELCAFSKSRSAFFADFGGDVYHYILPELKDKLLGEEERKAFVSALFDYMSVKKNDNKVLVVPKAIKRNAKLKEKAPVLYDMMEKYGFDRVCAASVCERGNTVSVIGVINPGIALKVSEILKEIAVCFSIAVKNKNSLISAEKSASTDSLTGLLNRASLDKDLEAIENDKEAEYAVLYIDINELHMFNNKFGHAAGDKMIITIAETYKKAFEGSSVYRVGGDEIIILVKNESADAIDKRLSEAEKIISAENYHVAVGYEFKTEGNSFGDVIRAAEKKMYEEKILYYKKKSEKTKNKVYDADIKRMDTGIEAIDDFLYVMSNRYRGIYFVDTDTDTGNKIVMPEYFDEFEDESGLFSKTFFNYVTNMVKSDYHRGLMDMSRYDLWKKQRRMCEAVEIEYERIDGERIKLTVNATSDNDTIWLFERG